MKLEQEFYNLDEVAKVLGVKVRTVREWVIRGKIKGRKLPPSRRWFVTAKEMERIVSEQPQA